MEKLALNDETLNEQLLTACHWILRKFCLFPRFKFRAMDFVGSSSNRRLIEVIVGHSLSLTTLTSSRRWTSENLVSSFRQPIPLLRWPAPVDLAVWMQESSSPDVCLRNNSISALNAMLHKPTVVDAWQRYAGEGSRHLFNMWVKFYEKNMRTVHITLCNLLGYI